MLEYFVDNSLFPETVAALKREAQIDVPEGKAGKGLLEKKWTSVVRLQKKVFVTACYICVGVIDALLIPRLWNWRKRLKS